MKKMMKTAAAVSMAALMTAACGCGANNSAPAPAPTEAPEETPVVEEVQEDLDLPLADEDPGEVEDFSDEVCPVCLGGAEDVIFSMEESEESYDEDASYRFDYYSADGITSICDTGRAWYAPESASPEDAALEMASWVLPDGYEYYDEYVVLNDEYSAKTTYPVYIVSFTTGENEDMRAWKVYTVATDTCGLAFGISSPVDYEDDMLNLSDRVFFNLAVIDRQDRVVPGNYDLDLFDYFETDIEDVATNLTDLQLDDSYKTSAEETTTYSGPTENMEKQSDGISLAGPFFSVDHEGTVVGIYYGGTKQTLCGLCAGMDMNEAAEIAKGHGFEFSRLEVAHGTAVLVAIYEITNEYGVMELALTSDADAVLGETEESAITGTVDSVNLYLR